MEEITLVEKEETKTDIDVFVVKSVESKWDANVYKRLQSESGRYDFRYGTPTYLPEAGDDPTEKKAKKGKKSGYYYHVTSFANLARICEEGLNPKQGGGIGGSSFQNSDKEMNLSSAKESVGKVYVATMGKLTERYISLRLRQEDLLEKHRDFIINTLSEYAECKPKFVANLLDRLQFGEMPAVLRFKNHWDPECWERDPIEKKAFALVGQSVSPDLIECLTSEGWVPVSKMGEMAKVYAPSKIDVPFRKGLLAFYGAFNDKLEKMSSVEAYLLEKELIEKLVEAGALKKK